MRKIALYKIPEVLEEAEISDASVLERYNESLKSMNPRAQEVLGKFGDFKGELKGGGGCSYRRHAAKNFGRKIK